VAEDHEKWKKLPCGVERTTMMILSFSILTSLLIHQYTKHSGRFLELNRGKQWEAKFLDKSNKMQA